MHRFTKTIKTVSLFIAFSILACTAPVRTIKSEKLPYLTSVSARQKLTGYKKVRLVNKYGVVYKGYIIGWNEIGFIGQMYDRVDTVRYDLLNNIIQVENNKTQAGKGAKIGGLAGALIFSFFALITFNYPNDNNKEFGETNTILFLTFGPLLVGGGTGLGAIIGSNHYQHDNYRYVKEEFIAGPWILPDFGNK